MASSFSEIIANVGSFGIEKREEEEEEKETQKKKKRETQTANAEARNDGVRGGGCCVGRKFKIEYLASNFHRSSKNRAVSYLAGGPAPPLSFLGLASSSYTRETRVDREKTAWKEKRAESSPLHTDAAITRYGIGHAPT